VAVIGVVFLGQLARHPRLGSGALRLGFSHAAELALRREVGAFLLVFLLSLLLPPKARSYQTRERWPTSRRLTSRLPLVVGYSARHQLPACWSPATK
jgi:hypothetical protein